VPDQHRPEHRFQAHEVGGAVHRGQHRRAGRELAFGLVAVKLDEVPLDRGAHQLPEREQYPGGGRDEQQRDAQRQRQRKPDGPGGRHRGQDPSSST
jgi:hypothetical protein